MKKVIYTAALLLFVTFAHAQDDKKTPAKTRSSKSDTSVVTSQPRPARMEKQEKTGTTKSSQNSGQPEPVRTTGVKKK